MGWTSRYRPKKTKDGYRSKEEQVFAKWLTNNKIKFKYEKEKIPYTIDYTYEGDFTLDNGIIIEYKGFFEYEDRRKHIAIKEQHPELDIRFVFSNLKAPVQNAKMTCEQWCKKYGFKYYAEKTMPIEWALE